MCPLPIRLNPRRKQQKLPQPSGGQKQSEVEAMELEYGVKIARPAQDLAFDSLETESAFVLLLHLPEEEREGIEIEVSKDGADLRISGGGGGSTREHVLSRRVRLSREEEVERFHKAFRIPEGVDTQKIEADYDKGDEVLLVFLPKLVAGPAAGARIEEIKDEEERGEAKDNPPREPEETHKEEETQVLVEPPEAEAEEEVAFEGGEQENIQIASPPGDPEPEAAKMPAVLTPPRPPREPEPKLHPTLVAEHPEPEPPTEDQEPELVVVSTPPQKETELDVAPTPRGSPKPEVEIVPKSPPKHQEPEQELQPTPPQEDREPDIGIVPTPPPANPEPEVDISETPTQEVQEPKVEIDQTPPQEDQEPQLEVTPTRPLQNPEPELEIAGTPPQEDQEPEIEVTPTPTPPPGNPEPRLEVVRTPPPGDPEPELEIVGTPPPEYAGAELELEPTPPQVPDGGGEDEEREQEIPVPGTPEDAPSSPETVAAPEEAPGTGIEEEGGGGGWGGEEEEEGEEESGGDEGGDGEAGARGGIRRRRRRPLPFSKPFMLAGSAFFFSVVALAFHVLRGRSRRRHH